MPRLRSVRNADDGYNSPQQIEVYQDREQLKETDENKRAAAIRRVRRRHAEAEREQQQKAKRGKYGVTQMHTHAETHTKKYSVGTGAKKKNLMLGIRAKKMCHADKREGEIDGCDGTRTLASTRTI